MANIQLPQITLDRLSQSEVGEECGITVPIARTDMNDMMKWCNSDEIIKNLSLIQPSEEFYLSEEFNEEGDAIYYKSTHSTSEFGDSWEEASQMTPVQSRFHGVCVNVRIVPINEWVGMKEMEDIRERIFHYRDLCEQLKTEPSIDDYVFYITIRRTK